MKPPAIGANETERLAVLRSYEILDTPPEPRFDTLTKLAANILKVPIALITFVDTDRQWFKSRYGLDAPETPRDVSFCGHVVAAEAPLVVPDALQDLRFSDNPLVTGIQKFASTLEFHFRLPMAFPSGLFAPSIIIRDRWPGPKSRRLSFWPGRSSRSWSCSAGTLPARRVCGQSGSSTLAGQSA